MSLSVFLLFIHSPQNIHKDSTGGNRAENNGSARTHLVFPADNFHTWMAVIADKFFCFKFSTGQRGNRRRTASISNNIILNMGNRCILYGFCFLG